MPTENRSINTEMVSEMLSCPFCGQQDFLIERLDSDASVVICQGLTGPHEACLARGPVGLVQDEGEEQPGRDKAIELWNARAEQHHAEPTAWYDPTHRDFITAEGRAATLRMGDGDCLARYSVRLFAAPTAAEELDSVRHWRGKHTDVMRERDTLRAQLTKQEELLGAIAGWTTETRAAVLEAFQDELNECASYAWYDAAIADLMALVGAYPTAPSQLFVTTKSQAPHSNA